MIAKFIKEYLTEVGLLLAGVNESRVAAAAKVIADCTGTVYCAGNGGSAATASHFALDLMKRAGAHTHCLSDAGPVLTAILNDDGAEKVFVNQVSSLGRNDVVVVITVSGDSPDIVALVRFAAERGAKIVALCSAKGAVPDMVRLAAIVPDDHYGRVEDAHLSICHAISYGLQAISNGGT